MAIKSRERRDGHGRLALLLPQLVIASLLSLASLCVCLITLAPDVLPGDSGEFQFAAPLLSIVHPTGYPLYLLLAKVFTFIPIGSIAYRVNLFSAVCAAFATGLFYVVTLRSQNAKRQTPNAKRQTPNANPKSQTPNPKSQTSNPQSPIPNPQSPIPNPNSQHLTTEPPNPPTIQPPNPLTPRPPNHLTTQLAAITAALALAFSPTFWLQATQAEVYALNSVFVVALIGLSLHVRGQQGRGTSWLWLALVMGLSLTHHRSIMLLVPALFLYLHPLAGLRKVWKRALFFVTLPLLLYFYTPLRYDATPYVQIKLDEQHVITTLAKSPSAFVAHALGTGFGGELRWDGQSVERLLATAQLITREFSVAGVALALLGIVDFVRSHSWRMLWLLIAALMVFIAFNAAYHIGDIADFYTPVYIVVGLLIAHGVGQLGRVHSALAVLALALPLTLFVANFASMKQQTDYSPRAEWQHRLSQDLPPTSILISNDRDEMTPLYYLQLVEAIRPEIVSLFPLIANDAAFKNVVSLTKYSLETHRPVYFIKPMDGLNIKFRVEPQGSVQRVIGLQDVRPATVLVRESSYHQFIGWTHTANKSRLEIVLFWQAIQSGRPNMKTYVHVLDRNGQRVAQSDHLPGGEFYPSSQWTFNEVLYDSHLIPLAANLPRGEYQLLAGAYLTDGQPIEGIARIDLGTIRLGE